MATVCPHCGAPTGSSADELDAGGRMMRCARCGTAWLARLHASGEGYALPVRRPSRPRFAQVIDHVDPGFARPAAPRPARAARPTGPARSPVSAKPAVGANAGKPNRMPRFRRWLGSWPSIAAGVSLAVVVASLSLYWSGLEPANAQFAGLEIRFLRGAIEPAREGRALAVEGEIMNRTDAMLGVPAVRISLLSDGVEVYSWMVEPTTTRLAAGRAVVFRSVLAAPPAGVDEVAFRLAERQDTVVGMN